MNAFSVNVNGVTVRARVERSAKGQVWRYKFRYPTGRTGRQYEGTLGAADLLTRFMIRKMLMDRIQQVMSGPSARQVLLSEAIKRYMERHGCHLTEGGRRAKIALEALKAFTRDRPMDEITVSIIEDYRSMRLKGVYPPPTAKPLDPSASRSREVKAVTPSTVNRDLTVIKSFWNKMILWGLCKSNPTKGIKKLRESPGRVRYLVDDEWPKLEEAAKAGPWWIYPACMLARHAGLRRGEVRRLKWSDIDLDNALIRIQNTKGNRNEVIPLNSALVEMLWDLPREGEHVLFGSPGASVGNEAFTRSWRNVVKAAKITDLRFHDLRHDFASRIVMAGRGIEAARVLLRHRDLRMAERYAHLSPQYLRDAVEAISDVRGGEVVADNA